MSVEPGKKYEVVFNVPEKKLPRVMVARYLGMNASGYDFDQRPKAGTTTIQQDQVVMYRLTDKEVHTPKIFRGGSGE
jgi:hypothetical protein